MTKNILLPVFSILLLFAACTKQETISVSSTQGYEEYITGFTSGEISSGSEIAVSFSNDIETESQLTQNLFRFNPGITGEAEWVNERTVVFYPAQKLKNGQEYIAEFTLSKVMDVPDEKKKFSFRFSTIRQDMEVEINGLELVQVNQGLQRITGTVFTADKVSEADIKRIMKAVHEDENLNISWIQNNPQTRHDFQISGITRMQNSSSVEISWDGSPIGSDAEGEQEIEIPAIGNFELIGTKIFRDQNPRIELIFSDPLDASQNLAGLVRLESGGSLNFIVNENKLIINPGNTRNRPENLIIDEAVRNSKGKRLGVEYQREIRFSQPAPQVELLGKGMIIPRSNNLYLPFKAVSLGAVDVQVVRIFENNIGQFLQDQNLDGTQSWNIRRVGRAVYNGTIPLSALGNVDPGEWNNFALDLSEIIEPQPGAIYKVEIGFRQQHAVYPCGDNSIISNTNLSSRNWMLSADEEAGYWNRYDDYYYPSGYNWRDRDDPCTLSYYMSDKRRSRNVLASDLGIIAKRGETGEVQVFVTDLKVAEPRPGVTITAYDFQQQEMVATSTDASGKAVFDVERDPFYLVASRGDQKGYLKMEDGSSLSLSEFDVSGARIENGLKGFLYGERGVWRPGDSLFVTLILEDKNEVLPDDHPVSFELRDPSGQLSDRQTFTSSLNGFYVYKGKTERQAKTGNWRLTARVGGQSFTKVLKIESVKPNRLKVELDLANDEINARTRLMEATLSSRWLHGATARDLKADVEMSLTPSEPEFENFRDFSFNDETVSFSSSPEKIFEGKLDGNGEAEFDHRFAALDEGPGRLMVNLNLRVFEPSGSFSVGRAGTFYYPFKTLVGVKAPAVDNWNYQNWLSRNETYAYEVVTTDEKGEPVAFKQLEYELYNIRWRWWWERSRENLSNFFERRNSTKILSGKVTTGSDGTNKIQIKLPEGADGGRYLLRVKDPVGRHSSSTIVYYRWGRGRNSAVSPAQLTFTSDKEKYNVDEEVTLKIPSSAGSKILVSLETGSKILKTAWIDAKDGETEYRFFADGEMSPTIYAHVMHIQPHGQDENDLPIRMYGVIPIEVQDPHTILRPQIEMAQELRPETEVQINISEESGREMTYTIAMVDEGLLDLTNFRTPTPHDLFYAREALGIKTWDMFEYVTSGFSGNISRILSVGGDGSEREVDPLNEANRFEPMVRFEGPFHLEPGKVNQHSISVPNYVGSVRTMVIAGEDGAYGQTQKTTPVRKPVMVLATLPRVLGPGETVSLPVNVFAMKENVRNVQVRVEASDIFEIHGDPSTTVRFDEPGDQLVSFSLKTKSEIGVGKVRVEVSSGNETAYHEIEIAVRNPNTPFVDVRSDILEEGEEWDLSFDPQGMTGTNTAVLEVSRIPPIDFGRRLAYLLRYPHGCIEQTTSSVFPQLFIDKVMDISDERKEKIQDNVEGGIARIAKFMTPSGGLGYWPGYEDPNSWGTSYAYHFLLEAQKQGYYVPSDLLNKINTYQKNYARNWSKSKYRRSDLIQAYRLYTLALAQTPELGAMNRFRERTDLSAQAKWRIASAYALIGQPEAANDILQGVSTSVPDYRELSGSYGSSLRDRAMILETLALLGRQEDAALVARDISEELSSQRWLNTQTTAYSLIAISKFLEENNVSGNLEASFVLNGSQEGSLNTGAFVVQMPLNMDEYDENRLVLKNEAQGTLFARVILTGTPLIGDNISSSNSLVQKVKFTTLDGNEIDPAEIEQGTDFVAEVSLSNPGLRGNYEEMALTQIFPSGWEIRNSRMDGESFKEPTSSYEYQDIRDDRIYTYFDLNANSSRTYRVQLNASYLGEFYLPAVKTEAMYDETISARTPGKWVKVVAPN